MTYQIALSFISRMDVLIQLHVLLMCAGVYYFPRFWKCVNNVYQAMRHTQRTQERGYEATCI